MISLDRNENLYGPAPKCFEALQSVGIEDQVKEALQQFLERREMRIKFFTEPEFADCVRITLGTEDHNRMLLAALSDFFTPGDGRS
ncbi:MAG: hypothetical protein V1799_03960 [bacterium]